MKVSILCITLAIIPLCLSADVVHIPDANLERVLREAMQLDSSDRITVQHTAELRVLNAQNQGIKDISGLEYATNLTELRLGENPIADISPLMHLTQLTFLRLNDIWGIEDISPLAHLTQLELLDLDRNLIADIGPLAGLTTLESLDLRYNQIEDILPLAALTQLSILSMNNNKIVDISPLANLTQLTLLWLGNNKIVDISPLAGLTALESLDFRYNQIEDILPLAALTQLSILSMNNNKIVDISPLANLTQLTRLLLSNNKIKDVRPLATLTRLEILDIQANSITDHSPLDGLSLIDFFYDQTCDMPPLPLEPRLANRDYPNVAGANWIFGQDPRIDLIYGNLLFQMYPRADGRLIGDVESALKERDDYIAANPNAVFLTALNDMYGGAIDYWGEDSPYWVRDSDGNIVFDRPFTEGGPTPEGVIDFTHPEVQDIIVQQAISVSKCGLFDGIIFDGWKEDDDALHGYVPVEAQLQARLNIVRRIRASTRSNFLIQVNSNRDILPHTGKYINGFSMEMGIPNWGRTPEEREAIVTDVENVIVWGEENLREPRINAIFGEAFPADEQPRSANFQWVRLITTLSLTHSNGYAMIQHLGLPIADARHWHDFWDADLGQPVGAKGQLYQEIDGLYIREFTNGWAVYNHSGETQELMVPELVTGVASGVEGTTHTLPNLDGEMYLRVKPVNPADVNGDGMVNILDLVAVAQAFGKDGLQGDVNGDGVVNVFDLVFVAGAIGGGGAAPSAYSSELSIISATDVERWLRDAQGLSIGDANFQRGIRFLEGLLAALTPKETTLLPNYPNPFNPETWIPYRLAREAEVAITIYDTMGTQVRRLALGNQSAGYYAARGKAAHWDGRNEEGETVASGIYIYQFRAGDYAASRRMVIVK